jgi:hypothetical protein
MDNTITLLVLQFTITNGELFIFGLIVNENHLLHPAYQNAFRLPLNLNTHCKY